MCKHGTDKQIHVIHRNNPNIKDGWHEINVDACIANEIQELNNLGIITLGCCCGHGKFKPQCLVDQSSTKKLEELNYKIREYSPQHSLSGVYEIFLKTGDLVQK